MLRCETPGVIGSVRDMAERPGLPVATARKINRGYNDTPYLIRRSMFNPALIKPVIGFVVGVCTSRTVSQLVRANVATPTTLSKVQVLVAAGALGSVAGTAASQAVLNDFEEAEKLAKMVKEQLKEKE